MTQKKRYVQVGVGIRAQFYYEAVVGSFKETSELVGFCDINQTRMDYANKCLQEKFGIRPIPTYNYTEFDEMVKKEKPDVVIVTSVDRTHHTYIIRAMELGCDVITEKPMTIDEEKAQAIIDTINKTGRKLRVAFNYRYSPHHTQIRELIMDGTIGDIFSVHFEWLLDTNHGADYYRRWHRDKKNSGGLLVHKSTHHFDLVNFWLDSSPKTVFAMGDLMFYGRENAEKRGVTKLYSRVYGSENAKGDPFALHMEDDPVLKGMYLDAEKDDGYIRDQSVFGDGINMEDAMGVMVRYNNNAILTYSLNSYMPWEGYRISFNGSKGRIQVLDGERTYKNVNWDVAADGGSKKTTITVFPMFDQPYDVPVAETVGGHGGGDPVLLNDIFGTPEEDKFKRAASHVDGAMSILTGVAANKSISTGLPVNISDLIRL